MTMKSVSMKRDQYNHHDLSETCSKENGVCVFDVESRTISINEAMAITKLKIGDG